MATTRSSLPAVARTKCCSLAQRRSGEWTHCPSQFKKDLGLLLGSRWLPPVLCLHHGAPWLLTVRSCIACFQIADTDGVMQSPISHEVC